MLEDLLKQGFDLLDIQPEAKLLERFRGYYELLEEKNKVMNLTAISGEDDVAKLHFLDSLSLLSLSDFNGKSCIDIGSGAGFPGFPIKFVCEDMKLTVIDALAKRIGFLNEVAEKTGISAECIHCRAEELAKKTECRESYDIAVSRAVARLNVLCELCLPFVKPGGIFYAMKSVDTEEELEEAKAAIKLLGGKTEKVWDYYIPCTDIPHRVIAIRKTGETPKAYPRRFAKIQKEPLGK